MKNNEINKIFKNREEANYLPMTLTDFESVFNFALQGGAIENAFTMSIDGTGEVVWGFVMEGSLHLSPALMIDANNNPESFKKKLGMIDQEQVKVA